MKIMSTYKIKIRQSCKAFGETVRKYRMTVDFFINVVLKEWEYISGVKEVFVFCVDGLTGFPDAIKGVFPKSDIQLCIVHLVRNSLKYVSYKYRKELARDLRRKIYHAGTLEGAEAALLRLGEKWNEKSSTIYALWERNWSNIITIFTYPAEIRRVIYTTNAIESLNGVTKKPYKNETDTRQR